jgi:hypothetical protein
VADAGQDTAAMPWRVPASVQPAEAAKVAEPATIPLLANVQPAAPPQVALA